MSNPVNDTALYDYFKRITTFIFDVDGVLTNGLLLVLDDGQMARQMNIRDGYALQLAVKKGYRVVIISGGDSPAVRNRLQKLGIADVFMKADDKKTLLQEYTAKHQLVQDELLFMGDDIPDHACMSWVALPCCPIDAAPEIRQVSRYVSPIAGGQGCVRDVIEKVLKLNGHWAIDSGITAR